ncbi:ATP-binding protein [Pseudomonas asiatica]|nr:ATP-binding protein [Pseudomonas shirazica]
MGLAKTLRPRRNRGAAAAGAHERGGQRRANRPQRRRQEHYCPQHRASGRGQRSHRAVHHRRRRPRRRWRAQAPAQSLRAAATAVDRLDRLPVSYSNRHADLLFEIVSRRYEHKSTVVTINRPFAEWGQVFPNAPCVVTLIDRLIHHAEIIAIEGESYRLK